MFKMPAFIHLINRILSDGILTKFNGKSGDAGDTDAMIENH